MTEELLEKPEVNKISNKQEEYNIEEIWKIVLENIRMYVSARQFSTWFKNVYLEKIENGIAELSCDQSYKREWLENNHRALIKRQLLQVTGQNLEIVITVKSILKKGNNTEDVIVHWGGNGLSIFESNTKSTQEEIENAMKEAHLNPRYLFKNFIVGSHNRLAHAVGEAIVDEIGIGYNPVFFYGPTGVGKTHLMQAIGNEILKRDYKKKIIYVSIEQFMNELIESIRKNLNEEFRKKYREIDVLIIDDIQFIETYAKTQEEVFNTFNTLYQSNKQIIIAADRPPKEIKNIADRLRSRFEGGMVADIKSPDFETRMAILNQITNDKGVQIDRDILHLIAQSIENNVRELEGAAIKIISMSKFGNTPSIEEVARILEVDIESKRKKIKPEKILEVVCEVFDVKPKEIKGQGRSSYIALTRQVIMYLLRSELNLQLEKIALLVNRKDHTTVIHACEKIEKLIEKDTNLKERIDKCRHLFS